MTCEQIRESVETVNVSAAAAQHAQACPACRKDMAATTKLVSLLNAQPQVKAPADFMARLQMRMATETVNENAQLKRLLQSVPAITAPPDFAFRVRARLAQEKAQETASNPLVWLQNWFAQSFSFGQAASAMAAIALIAVFTTMQLRNSVAPAQVNESTTMTARVIAPPSVAEVIAPSVPQNTARTSRPSLAVGSSARAIAPMPVKDIARAMPTAEMAEPAMYNPKSKEEYRIKDAYFGRELQKVVVGQRPESVTTAF